MLESTQSQAKRYNINRWQSVRKTFLYVVGEVFLNNGEMSINSKKKIVFLGTINSKNCTPH